MGSDETDPLHNAKFLSADKQYNPEYTEPNPHEELTIDQGNGRVWKVKIPPFLMARWAAVTAEDVHLATIRVYRDLAKPDDEPRIILFLPPNHDPSLPTPPAQNPKRPHFDTYTTYATVEPDTYELEIINKDVENQLVVAERPKDTTSPAPTTTGAQTPSDRAIQTNLVGRVNHECTLRPCLNESYWKHKQERNKNLTARERSIRRIEDAGISWGTINMLSSAASVRAVNVFSDLVKTKPKPTKGSFERMARIPRNQLMDSLFNLFREEPRWTIRNLREETQQPEAYLREVLSEIAFIHRSGEWNGMWEINESFKDVDEVKPEDAPINESFKGIKEENVPVPDGIGMEDIHYDNVDNDDDLEQVF